MKQKCVLNELVGGILMGLTLLAQECKIGTTTYYLANVKANTLIQNVGYASEMENWPDMSIDERMQREIKGDRVAEEIVPYIVNDPDWFFGAVIVDVYKGWENVKFQGIKDVVEVKFDAYDNTLNNVGFLTLPDEKNLIALDGQHRLAALSMAIRGKNGIPGSVQLSDAVRETLVPHPEIGKADISVIFIKHTDNNTKIRKIFNKVNRYAKQTSKSDNIITSEDDMVAIVARALFSSDNGPLKPVNNLEIVNWKSNTIPARSRQLTTLSAIYTSCEIILSHYDITPKILRNEKDLEKAKKIMMDYWHLCMTEIDAFKLYTESLEKGSPLEKLRKENLLLKPVTHMALAYATYMILEAGFEFKDMIEKINKIDWSAGNPVWSNILVTNSGSKKMITGSSALKNAGGIIAYMLVGNKISKAECDRLLGVLREAADDETVELPDVIE